MDQRANGQGLPWGHLVGRTPPLIGWASCGQEKGLLAAPLGVILGVCSSPCSWGFRVSHPGAHHRCPPWARQEARVPLSPASPCTVIDVCCSLIHSGYGSTLSPFSMKSKMISWPPPPLLSPSVCFSQNLTSLRLLHQKSCPLPRHHPSSNQSVTVCRVHWICPSFPPSEL